MQNKFREFFRGLERNYGFCDLTNAKVNSETGKLEIPTRDYGWSGKPITDQEYLDHLEGKISIGVQPCREDGKVIFAAIDVDHYKNFDKQKFLKLITDNKIPLIPVKSKSGGFHLYLHLKEPTSAVFVKQFLKGLLYTLKLTNKTEIFPKQTNVETSVGNFINLPYFGKKERIAINPMTGEEFSFEQYLQVIEFNQQTEKQLKDFMVNLTNKELVGGNEEFEDGPPCLQILSKNKLDDYRDRFLYQYMVFAKKKYSDWQEKVQLAKGSYFINDLKWTDQKVAAKIKSWEGKETGYVCEEFKSEGFCMEELCYKRKFGKKSDKIIQWPELTSLVKINYEEPEYDVTVTIRDKNGDERSIQIHLKNIDDVMEMRLLRKQIAKQANTFLPKLKDKDFEPIVAGLLASVEEQKAPAGTSNKEKLYKYIKEHIKTPANTHASFQSGNPMIKQDKVYFIYDKFYDFLKRKEWKVGESKTAKWMETWFKAEFGKKPRFPKKDSQKESNPQVMGCVELTVEDFKSETAPEEILEMQDREDIL